MRRFTVSLGYGLVRKTEKVSVVEMVEMAEDVDGGVCVVGCVVFDVVKRAKCGDLPCLWAMAWYEKMEKVSMVEMEEMVENVNGGVSVMECMRFDAVKICKMWRFTVSSV